MAADPLRRDHGPADEVDPARFSWCDRRLSTVSWEEDGRDLVLEFLPDEEGKAPLRLQAGWAHAVRIDLATPPGTGGHRLTWGAEFTRTEENTWVVRVDFASAGEISFRCSHLRTEGGVNPVPFPLSELTGKVLTACFGRGPHRDHLAVRLENEVAGNVGDNPTFIDRARISVIRIVLEDPDEEDDAFRLAAEDVRDLLMAAGHGRDTSAHLEWSRKMLQG